VSAFDSVDGYNLELSQTSAYNSGYQSGIVFSAKYNTGGSVTDLASIRGGKENTTNDNWAGNLRFYTRTHNGSDTERMRIDSSGNLLVGKTSVNSGVVGVEAKANGTLTATVAGDTVSLLNRKSNDGEILRLQKDGTTVGSIASSGGGVHFNGVGLGLRMSGTAITPSNGSTGVEDATNDLGTSAARFKDLYLSGGVFLGGAGASNKLDDYEEGAWTPTLPSGGTVTSTAGTVYTKIGNVVYFQMFMNMSGIPNNGSGFLIGGLPYAATTSASRQLHGHATITFINNVDGSTYGAGLPASNSTIYWHSKVNAATLANSNFTNVTQLILAGFYFTA
jgi:hypothetical protein